MYSLFLHTVSNLRHKKLKGEGFDKSLLFLLLTIVAFVGLILIIVMLRQNTDLTAKIEITPLIDQLGRK